MHIYDNCAIQRYQDRFRTPDALMAKWRLQTLSFKSVTDKEKKIEKQNSNPSRRKTGSLHIPLF